MECGFCSRIILHDFLLTRCIGISYLVEQVELRSSLWEGYRKMLPVAVKDHWLMAVGGDHLWQGCRYIWSVYMTHWFSCGLYCCIFTHPSWTEVDKTSWLPDEGFYGWKIYFTTEPRSWSLFVCLSLCFAWRLYSTLLFVLKPPYWRSGLLLKGCCNGCSWQ